MIYKPLEAPTIQAIERYLTREIRRMTLLIKTAKRRPGDASEQAMAGIMLGEKFGYQTLRMQIRQARRRRP